MNHNRDTEITKSRIVQINLTGCEVFSNFYYPPFVSCIYNTRVLSRFFLNNTSKGHSRNTTNSYNNLLIIFTTVIKL